MYKELLLNNSKAGVPLPPGAEVFDISVETNGNFTGFWSEIPNSAIQPNTFMGIKISALYYGPGSTIFPGTYLSLYNYQAPVQNITVIRLDLGLIVKLERTYLMQGFEYYYSDQPIFSEEDIGKTIKIALVAN